MKKNRIIGFVVAAVIAVVAFQPAAVAQRSWDIGFVLGLSTPFDKVNEVYNSDKVSDGTNIGDFISDGASLGYHIGARVRIPLSDVLDFTGGISYVHFTESSAAVVSQSGRSELNTYQNLLPIHAGVNFYLISSFIGVYLTGDLQFNYINNNISILSNGSLLTLEENTSNTRGGFGAGIGLDLDAKFIKGNFEIKYNLVNLIGRGDNEGTKSYLNVGLGVFF